jgi:hypothetical protein
MSTTLDLTFARTVIALERVVQGAGDRLIKIAEADAEASIANQKEELRLEELRIWVAASLSLVVIAVGAGLAWFDRQLAGGLIGAGGMVGLATAFLRNRPKR